MKLLTQKDLRPLFDARPDQKDYTLKRYFHPLQKIPYLARFKLVLKLLRGQSFDNFLDIGFGSGIFIPELTKKTNNFYGIDLHQEVELVKNIINNKEISANLQKADVTKLPFENNYFDGILCLSVLEFVPDVKQAISEIKRVAKPGATIIIGAPVLNPLTDFLYQIIKFKTHSTDHKTNHKKIIQLAKKNFKVKKIEKYPSIFPLNYSLFFVLKLKN